MCASRVCVLRCACETAPVGVRVFAPGFMPWRAPVLAPLTMFVRAYRQASSAHEWLAYWGRTRVQATAEFKRPRRLEMPAVGADSPEHTLDASEVEYSRRGKQAISAPW